MDIDFATPAAVRTVGQFDSIALDADAKAAVDSGRLNVEQAAAAYVPSTPTLVIGPPGTGKTKTLVERIGVRLSRGADPMRIFCATYTKAAAQEIIERVNSMHKGRLVAPSGKKLMFGTFNSLGERLLTGQLAPRAKYGPLKTCVGNGDAGLAYKLDIKLGGSHDRRRGAKSQVDNAIGGAEAPETAKDKPPQRILTAAQMGWFGTAFGDDGGLDVNRAATEEARPTDTRTQFETSGGTILRDLIAGKEPAAVKLGRVAELPFFDVVAHWQQKLITPDEAIRIAEGAGGQYVADDALARRARDYKRYKEAMWADLKYDFGDQISLTVWILQTHPELCAVVQRRFSDILVDEYQDVNHALGVFIDIMAAGSRSPWCVGDPDQTLYGYRGSDPSFIIDFRKRWPDATIIALRRNYRSQPSIITAANRLIRNNKVRYETELQPTKPEIVLPPIIGHALATPSVLRPRDAPREVGIEVVAYPDDVTEARDVARKVRGLLDGGVAPTEIAVFLRAGHRGYHIVQALRGQSIRIRVVGGNKGGDAEETKIIEGMIHAACYPSDVAGAPTADTIATLLGTGSGKAQTERGQRLMRAAAQMAKDGLSAADRWDDLCLRITEAINTETASQEARRLSAARIDSTIYGARMAGSYASWIGAKAITIGDNGGVGWQRVETGITVTTLGTIHGSKGLEYNHVFLPGMEADVCPNDGDIGNEEERRLAFVGLTRARETLDVSWAAMRIGNRYPSKPSPYIHEAFCGTPGIAWTDYPSDGAVPANADIAGMGYAGGAVPQPPAEGQADAGEGGNPIGDSGPTGDSRAVRGPVCSPEEWREPNVGHVRALEPGPTKASDADGPLSLVLQAEGGVVCEAIYKVTLREVASGALVYESLINPEGDCYAFLLAVNSGIDGNALSVAPSTTEVIGAIRDAVHKVTKGTGAVVSVTSHTVLKGLMLEDWLSGDGLVKAIITEHHE